MPAPFSTPRSKLDRAIVAYLIDEGAGTVKNIFPAKSSAEIQGEHIVVHAHHGIVEESCQGDYRFQVKIIVKSPAIAQEGVNPEIMRVAADNLLATAVDALMQSDNDQDLKATAKAITDAGRALAVDTSSGADAVMAQRAKDNADMVEFTCRQWYDAGYDGDHVEQGQGLFWMEIAGFTAVANSANVD